MYYDLVVRVLLPIIIHNTLTSLCLYLKVKKIASINNRQEWAALLLKRQIWQDVTEYGSPFTDMYDHFTFWRF